VIYDFADMLAYSQGTLLDSDVRILQQMIAGAVRVEKTDPLEDRSGTDYRVTLRGGRVVRIDAKTRRPGAAKYWSGDPELALEIWSVRPGGKYHTPDHLKKTGWTLSESNTAELILYTFAPQDTRNVYLLPFQHLRLAFRRNYISWLDRYKRGVEETLGNPGWESECVFVPFPVIWHALQDIARGRLTLAPAESQTQPKPLYLFPEYDPRDWDY
jgi:hypothetical protein